MHADVFRPPSFPICLVASLGTGMQLLAMACIAIFCAMLGFLSPANRGGARPVAPCTVAPCIVHRASCMAQCIASCIVHRASHRVHHTVCITQRMARCITRCITPLPGLLTATILLFVLMGVPAGYFSAHTYKSVKGTEWKKATLMTALLWPGVVVGAFFVLNFFIWGQASSGAMPLGTMLALLLMWFGISTPLVFVGAFFGFKAKITDPPTRTNEIPRQARPMPPHPNP